MFYNFLSWSQSLSITALAALSLWMLCCLRITYTVTENKHRCFAQKHSCLLAKYILMERIITQTSTEIINKEH